MFRPDALPAPLTAVLEQVRSWGDRGAVITAAGALT